MIYFLLLLLFMVWIFRMIVSQIVSFTNVPKWIPCVGKATCLVLLSSLYGVLWCSDHPVCVCVCVCVCVPGLEPWLTCCATSPALCSRTRGTTAWRWRWQTDRGAGPWDAPRRTTMPPADCPARITDVSADLWWEEMKWCLIRFTMQKLPLYFNRE
jgi:hypothetical protein